MKRLSLLLLAGAALTLAACHEDVYEYHTVTHHTVHHTTSGDTVAGSTQHLQAPGAPETFKAEGGGQ
jgi:hypothetical protein